MIDPQPENGAIAAELREMSILLERQQANPFRVRAYARAAATVDALDEPISNLYARRGREGLEALPGIGRGIASAIEALLQSGRFPQLERLRGRIDPEALFAQIPGVGPTLAARIHDELHVDTLEALEVAAHDGRLAEVPGIGARRAAAIRAVLGERLARRQPSEASMDAGTGQALAPDGTRSPGKKPAHSARPPVSVLLAADREYREKAARGELPRISPRRFNPEHKAWLPVFHTEQDGWHMTLLFSNTARAHELKRSHDWVVIYYYDEEHHEGQCTVVTEIYGPKAGRRVVRGREKERA